RECPGTPDSADPAASYPSCDSPPAREPGQVPTLTHTRSVKSVRSALRRSSMLDALEVCLDPSGVEWKDRQLGRRTPDEAVEEQEIFGLGQSESLARLAASEAAKRQAGIDLEPGACSRRKRAHCADSPGADEEGLLPARPGRRSDQADLQPAEPLEPAQA